MSTSTAATSTEMVCPEVKVGDYFVSSWGYDQTNIDFYKVISRTKASVKVQAWRSKIVSSTGYQDQVEPGDGPRMVADWSACDPDDDYWTRQEKMVERPAELLTKRLRPSYDGTPALTMNSYSVATLWDGQPESQTGSGFGH